jgi:hypothetical protein
MADDSAHEPMQMFLRVLARCQTMPVFAEKTGIAVGTANNIKKGCTGIGKVVLAKLLRFEEENPGDGMFYANEKRCHCGASLQGRQPQVRFCSHKCQRTGKENG